MYPTYQQPTTIISDPKYQIGYTPSFSLNVMKSQPYFSRPFSKFSILQTFGYPTDTSSITTSTAYQALLTIGLKPTAALEILMSLHSEGWTEPQILDGLVNEYGMPSWNQPRLPVLYSITSFATGEAIWIESPYVSTPARQPKFPEDFRWEDHDEKTGLQRVGEDPKVPGGRDYDWSEHSGIRGVRIERPVWEEKIWAAIN